MSLQELPTELVLNVFRHCSSISSAINLSLTCHRLYHLLRTSQKIPVLFSIAQRVWGPLDDIFQLLTYNATQPVHVKRSPVLSFALLTQVATIGRVAQWFEEIYPRIRWDGDRAHLRRSLSAREAHALRRSIYRVWLYAKAFHTPSSLRTLRMHPSLVAERCHLLRTFSTDELLELEDVRGMLECIVSTELCPTDGDVYWRRGGEAWNKKFYDPAGGRRAPNVAAVQSLFYDVRHDQATHMPANQLREQQMDGWGDDIDQYHAVNDLLKLNPAQVMQLYEHAVTRHDVEHFVDEKMGGPWFWNNGETMLHTWLVVLHGRGVVMQEAKEKIDRGLAGVAIDGEGVVEVD